ncbi:unnamed protein product [Rotaria sordida]|uniref:Elongator complex protein 6 n=1 Tax=Rotaria sordida TaxID=392033 RepID=A0A818P348_9BILA|nr:unnamed protein product [Rotaria sordida]CAF3614018.1 unnamed protein product [Rotaria sordida]
MFDELTALLDDTNRTSSHGSILITSLDFDSNFLLQHFLSYSLKNTLNCVYISLLTPFSHLKHVQNKMGNTLKTPEISSSSLMFIPLFSSLSDQFFHEKSSLNIDDLCKMIQQQVIASPDIIIIEDLQILRHLLKFSDIQVLLMQRKLRHLFPNAQFITQISISDDENDDENFFSSSFINMLKRIHNKHLFVRSLTTGATKDISGQLTYTGPSQSNLWTNIIIRKCLFRLTDRTLNLITSAV